jgi:hypothetical protein
MFGSQASLDWKMMFRWNSIARCTILAGFAAIVLLSSPSHAGEAVSERDELDNGPSYFGDAKEVRSLRALQNVQVRAEWGDRRMSTYTNDEGAFKIPSFGKETVVDNVTITCAKQGYRTLDVSRHRLSSAADAPVMIECLLEPAP